MTLNCRLSACQQCDSDQGIQSPGIRSFLWCAPSSWPHSKQESRGAVPVSEVPSTQTGPLCPAEEAQSPPESGRRRDANLVGVIDVRVHAVLDHLLHQQGVGLVADLSKPEREACQQLRGPT